MTGLEIVNCEIGTIRSRKDHSVVFSVETPELRVSESGQLMQWHGRSCSVRIVPHDGPPVETVVVDTARKVKSYGERLRAIHWLIFSQNPVGDFERFHAARMETIIAAAKEELPDR